MLKYSVVVLCLFILGIYAMEQEKVCDICTDPDPVMKIKFPCQHEICITCFTKIHELNNKQNEKNNTRCQAKCPYCRAALFECYHYYSLKFLRNPTSNENISSENLQQIFPLICQLGNIKDVKYWVEKLNVEFEVKENDNSDIWVPDYGTPISNSGSKEIAKYLLKKWTLNRKWNEKLVSNAVQQAAKIGNVKMLEYWINKKNSAADEPNGFGNTPLFWAAKYGRMDCVRFLVDKWKVNIHSRNGNDCTPLIVSCEQSNLEIVKFLKERGGNIYDVKKDNASTLYQSICLFNSSISKYLLDEGMNPNVQLNCGSTAFFFVCQVGRLDFVKLLANYDANMALARNDGMTPLFATLYFAKNYEIAKFILRNIKPQDVQSTLTFALENEKEELVRIIKTLNEEILMEKMEQLRSDDAKEVDQFWDALDYIGDNNNEFKLEHEELQSIESLENETKFWDTLDYIPYNNTEFKLEHGESDSTEPLANESEEVANGNVQVANESVENFDELMYMGLY